MPSEPVRLGHVALEVASIDSARRFHDRFLATIGFERFQEGDWYLGYRRRGFEIWFFREGRNVQVRRDTPRPPTTQHEVIPEHIGFEVPSWAAIARWEDRLRARGLEPFYPVDRGPPRAPEERYRSAAWIDADRIVWELYSARRTPVPRSKGTEGRAATVSVARGRRRP